MKLGISVLTAIGLSLTCTASAGDYGDLIAQGFRWVAVDVPYACATEEQLQRLGVANKFTLIYYEALLY